MAAPSWIKRFDDDEGDKDLEPRSLSRYSTPHGSLSELSHRTGSTRYLEAPNNGNESDAGHSKYSYYNETQARELPRRYLSPANATRDRTVDQNRGRRNLNSRYQGLRYYNEEERGGRHEGRMGSGEPRRKDSWAYIDNVHTSDVEVSELYHQKTDRFYSSQRFLCAKHNFR